MTTIDYIKTGRPESDMEYLGPSRFAYAKPIPRITCQDGFSLSVQAGSLLYSTPRTDEGPWTEVEVGFPSDRPEPWDVWSEYAEEPSNPTRTVYSYIPVEHVEALIVSHGGEADRV